MVRLGVEEVAERGDLGRDVAVAGVAAAPRRSAPWSPRRRPAARRRRCRSRCGTACRRRCPGACPGVGSWSSQNSLSSSLVGDDGRVEHDEHDLGVPGAPGAHLLVGRVRRVATGVADGRRPHAGRLPEQLLGAPEAAEPEHGGLVALGPRALQGMPVDVVRVGHGHRLVGAAGEGVGRRHHRRSWCGTAWSQDTARARHGRSRVWMPPGRRSAQADRRERRRGRRRGRASTTRTARG